MGGHFECIGLRGAEEELGHLLQKLAETATVLPADSNHRLLRWLDASGAALYFHIGSDDSVECVTPSYNTAAFLQARIRSFSEQDECRHCNPVVVEILDDSGEMLYPMVLQLENAEGARNRFEGQGHVRLRVAGFAERLEAWSSEDEFLSSQPNNRVKFGPQSFIPIGQFGAMPSPHAQICGTVVDSQLKHNSETGELFWLGHINTYGTEYEVVASIDDVPPQMQAGWVVNCRCWMVGDLSRNPIMQTAWTRLSH